jgi:glycosyltransferase involved in cell wall biosynthesis
MLPSKDGTMTPRQNNHSTKNVLVEGWRGINQSYAMVNQYQLLELACRPDIAVFHDDRPYMHKHWDNGNCRAEFPAAMKTTIDQVPPSDGRPLDAVLRVDWPFERSTANATKVLTFVTAEAGLRPGSFAQNGKPIADLYCGNASIVCPSQWTRMKLLEYGFPDDRIAVVSHGIHPEIFFPTTSAERCSVRTRMSLAPEHHVFLNLGAMTANKGIDLLLRAFFEVRIRHPQARLVLKDEKNLYGVSGATVIQEAINNYPQLSNQAFVNSITLLSVTLPLAEMRDLYSMADCYVSPYRAEGFNLPVIEAIACGTPVIVTAGGATDDFCEPRTSTQVSATRVRNVDANWPGTGYHLEPDIDALISAMEADILAPRVGSSAFLQGHNHLRETFSWAACVDRLVQLF